MRTVLLMMTVFSILVYTTSSFANTYYKDPHKRYMVGLCVQCHPPVKWEKYIFIKYPSNRYVDTVPARSNDSKVVDGVTN